VFGFLRRCQVVLEVRALQRPDALRRRWPQGLHSVPYHVPPDARATLRHAARLALASDTFGQMHVQQLRSTLPPLHRMLLSTPAGCAHTGNYQEAVAGALAAELGATMLVLDSPTLDALVAQVG